MSTTDLVSNARKSGTEIDIDCYELDASTFSCSAGVDRNSDFTNVLFTFTASTIGATGTPQFTWDFDDGTSLVTTSLEVTHAYATGGVYRVRLSATDTNGSDADEVDAPIIVATQTTYMNAANEHPQLPYDTPEHAAQTLKGAFGMCTNEYTNGKIDSSVFTNAFTIKVAPGTYTEYSFDLNVPYTVEGGVGNPTSIVIQAQTTVPSATADKSHATSARRPFILRHDGAVLRGITIANGKSSGGADFVSYVGNIQMSAGLVEDCILKNGTEDYNGFSGNIYITGGRVVRCRILNGQAHSYKAYCKTAQIYMIGCTVENSLVTGARGGNRAADSPAPAAIAFEGETIVNCTIVDNAGLSNSKLGCGMLGNGLGHRLRHLRQRWRADGGVG